VPGEEQGGRPHALSDLCAPGGDAEGRAAVPDAVLGEERRDLVGDPGQGVCVDHRATAEAAVDQLGITALQVLDLENGFRPLHTAAERLELGAQGFDVGHDSLQQDRGRCRTGASEPRKSASVGGVR
jgi:hypothetical protein